MPRPGRPPTPSARRVGTGRSPAPGARDRRSGHPAGQGHLVPDREPAPPRRHGRARAARNRRPALAEIVRIYGIRHWIEQGYKQVKDELGWADSRSAPTSRSAVTGCWSTARSASAGPPGSPIRRRAPPRRRHRKPAAERGGPGTAMPSQPPCWPQAIRAVRAWLAPWITLRRWWAARSTRPSPRSCKRSLTRSRQAAACTSTSGLNKPPLEIFNSRGYDPVPCSRESHSASSVTPGAVRVGVWAAVRIGVPLVTAASRAPAGPGARRHSMHGCHSLHALLCTL